ncbi:MAG: ABC transporter ATP-binding protein [Cetobacterium sp.]|uniref:ABC transporter ATP-binding protein n=2 Tax=Cetobacterium sp. TaxID=2071632 RepID=UPI002FC89ED6
MDNILKVENLFFKTKNKKILKNINFDVKTGEIIGLIGVNGSGKTTLLKCLNSLNKITEGKIEIKNKSLSQFDSKEIAREVALMGQNTNLNAEFKCLDIVVMGRYPHLKNRSNFCEEDYLKALDYMDATNTLKFKDKNITNLSGGERQRVLFSKVIAQETDIILLDEPTASMDLNNQEQLFKICKKMAAKNKTIIISTHDLRVAARYCDKLLLLKNGEKVGFGRVEEVLTKENIKKAYEIDVEIFENPISKSLDYHIY